MTYLKSIVLTACAAGLIVLIGGFGLPLISTETDLRFENGDPIEGAWELMQIRGEDATDVSIRMVKIISGGHFVFAFFNDENKQFYSAGGGKYTYEKGRYTEHIEFHTINPNIIGKSIRFSAKIKDGKWYHTGEIDGVRLEEVFQRIDDGKGKEHVGAWEIFRLSNAGGKMEPQAKNLRTIKLLSGTRFQWATWDQKKGDFVGTGGGSYETMDGYYTENLEFFSRDSIRVGQSITFGCEIKGDTWHHEEYAGSRGLQINEIWVRMKK
jgi:hypothetical protein